MNMKVLTTAITDIGLKRKSNQDSFLLKAASSDMGDYAMVCVCDGLGGLSKGELASADVIRSLAVWFDDWLAKHYRRIDTDIICGQWAEVLQRESRRIMEYSGAADEKMGTTFSGILISGDGNYLIGHIGDTRVYSISQSGSIALLTDDHTVTGAAVRQGTMSPEQAEKDPRRHVLTQCIGVSAKPDMDFIRGRVNADDIYLVCSDGFRNKLCDEEIAGGLLGGFNHYDHEEGMRSELARLVSLVKSRGERDNITAAAAWVIPDPEADTSGGSLDDTVELGFSLVADSIGVNTEEVIQSER
jgi:serine/threonine protein phosphatase PrpC